MIDDNPFEASTLAVVPDMSPEERVFGPMPLPVFVPPSVMDPVSNLDFLPVDDAFALEMRSETIEQLVGGDALRRGESERIEAGRSQTNADVVAGRDRVRVQGTLHEHTGHGLAEVAAHLHTTVDGTLDVHAASEDTVLLAGHMRDLWDGGAAIVAAMTDDTVAGGGIRVTTPLDLWLHGLMGVEERIGTCTADAVLMEMSGTHYEREYGPGAHAAGLAVYTGSLYQSSRSTFRPLMRVSSGVRNLIAGGGGGGEGGDGGGDGGTGGAPAVSPPPASAAGDAGTQAASETLSAATGAGGTAQAGVTAGVRSQDLAGIHRVDEVAAPARGANVAGACGDLSELRRGTDTAGQLAALRDAMRGGEAGPHGDVMNVSRVSEPGDTASVHEASALDIVGDIRSGATGPGMDVPVSPCAVLPRKPPPGVKLGLFGGGGGAARPASSGNEWWISSYMQLHMEYGGHRTKSNWVAARAFGDAISNINAKVIETYVEFGGSINAAKLHCWNGTPAAGFSWNQFVAAKAYRHLQDLAHRAASAGDVNRASGIEQLLASIDRLTVKFIDELDARTDEFDSAYDEMIRISPLDPRIDAQKVTDWIDDQIETLNRNVPDGVLEWARGQRDDELYPRAAIVEMEYERIMFFARARDDVSAGRDPGVVSYNRLRYAAEVGDVDRVETDKPLLARLLEAMADPSMRRPVLQGSEAGGAQAMAAPELGAQATFWLRPVDPVPAPGTVRFDAGLQRAGQQPQHSGEAAMGGTAALARSVPTPEEMLDASHLTVTSSWSEDAFDIERALIAGLMPPGFSPYLMNQLRERASYTEYVAWLNSPLLPTRAIDSKIEQLRTMEDGSGHIQHLEALKKSIDWALTKAYGYRADADWLATVDRFLKTGSPAQAVGEGSVSVPSRGEDIVGGAQASLQPVRVESAAAPGPTEWGAGELSPGAWSPAQDPWSPWSQVGSGAGELSPGALSPAQVPLNPRPQVGFGEVEVVPFDAMQPVSSLGAGGRGIAVGPTAGWQATETPGFGRLASSSAELAFSHREGIVRRLMAGEAVSAAPRAELIRRYEQAISVGAIASPAPRARTAPALFEDLRRLFVAARESPASAVLEEIDWAAIEWMLRLLDAPGL